MTNCEKYLEDIKKYGFTSFGYDAEEDEIYHCCTMDCTRCEFFDTYDDSCNKLLLLEWLNQEATGITIKCRNINELKSIIKDMGIRIGEHHD